jgi:phosphoglycolate phosphatase
MRYKCLVFDHDDTVVNSTATIHFPAFVAYLKKKRPGAHYTLEEYFRKNFDPGIMPLFQSELGFTDEEIEDEFQFWTEYVRTRVPKAYPGIREIQLRQKREGGLVCVVSHSVRGTIYRDYRENGLIAPDLVFGWDDPPAQRKPSTYSIERIEETFGLAPSELLIIDDLKPGCDMAHAARVPIAGAGWANDIPEIEAAMRKSCDFYFKTVAELDKFLR